MAAETHATLFSGAICSVVWLARMRVRWRVEGGVRCASRCLLTVIGTAASEIYGLGWCEFELQGWEYMSTREVLIACADMYSNVCICGKSERPRNGVRACISTGHVHMHDSMLQDDSVLYCTVLRIIPLQYNGVAGTEIPVLFQ